MSYRNYTYSSNIAVEWSRWREGKSEWLLINLFFFRAFSDFKRWMSLIDQQSTVVLRSTTAVLFQIKMSVCIVSLPVTKGPPQHTNCSFWKVLLGYRPAWRWNPLSIAFLQLYSSDIMSNLLRVQCRCMGVSICMYITPDHLSFSFFCVCRVHVWTIAFVSCKAHILHGVSSIIIHFL